ncbi:MAG: hypothetical protein RL701_4622 [Pseudomonadota bacterium]
MLMLDKDAHSELTERLANMAEAGLVTELPGGKYRAPKPGAARRPVEPPEPPEPAENARARGNSNGNDRNGRSGSQGRDRGASRGRGQGDERVGRVSVNARGFGFVLTEEEGPDVFIAPSALGNALHGDKVRVRVFPSPKGLDGHIVEVIERSLHYIGGQLQILPHSTFIEPDDERIKTRVLVTGALPAGAKSGQGVIAKVVGFPNAPGEPLLATVLEAFDAAEFAEFEIRRILLAQAVREEFSEEVEAEAQKYGDHVTAAEIAGRVDYRDLELLTIDPDDARDHDDAVFAERTAHGYRVIIAIADVSHYVKPGTALDHEALARGCTIYLPGRAIPMLPRALSSHLASLLPEVDRLALAADVELDKSGNVHAYKFVECVIRSAARLTYGGVARALGTTDLPERQPAAESRLPQLKILQDVAKLLGAQRKSRGSLDFDLPEAKVKLNPETGEPIAVERTRNDPGVRVAYNLVEEMMLLANEVVARDLSKRKLATIYRVHGAPNSEKVEAFAELAGSLGFKVDEDIAEKPGKLAIFLASVAGTPHAEVLSYLMLRAMQQATYSTDNIGHFGLAAEDYVHFTSPIRRYPDLAVHRAVRKIARGEAVSSRKLKSELDEQANESSRLERRAMLIEREVVDMYRAMLMRDRVGDEFEATITGITEHGLFAAIESPCVDVFCHVNSLPADHYQTDQFGTRLYGLAGGRQYALFDRLRVRIDEVSVARRRISATPIDQTEAEAPQQRRLGAGKPRSARPKAQTSGARPQRGKGKAPTRGPARVTSSGAGGGGATGDVRRGKKPKGKKDLRGKKAKRATKRR